MTDSNALKPIIKKLNSAQNIKQTFNAVIQKYLPEYPAEQPVNVDSRYTFINPGTQNQIASGFTSGKFVPNVSPPRLNSSNANAGSTVAPTGGREAYDPQAVLAHIVAPLVRKYSPSFITDSLKSYNYEAVLRTRTSTGNQIPWHKNAQQLKHLGTSIWQIVYYPYAPKQKNGNGNFVNTNESKRDKLAFYISKYNINGSQIPAPVAGLMTPQESLGVGAYPYYFYHKVVGGPQNVRTTRPIIVIQVFNPRPVTVPRNIAPDNNQLQTKLNRAFSTAPLINTSGIRILHINATAIKNTAQPMNINNNNTARPMNINNTAQPMNINILPRLIKNSGKKRRSRNVHRVHSGGVRKR